MGTESHMKRASRIVFSVFIGIAIVYLVYFFPLPYYIFMPGTAETVRPMVEVKRTVGEEKGQLLLTTVRVSDATVFGLITAWFKPYEELHKKQELLRNNETEQEYSERQEVVMQSSQASAILAAYNKLGIPYHISKDGVILLQVYKDYPAHEVLQAGDYIVKVDDKPVQVKEELLALLKEKKAGDVVSIGYKRQGVIRTKDIALKPLPDDGAGGPPRAGLGVVPENVQSIKANSETDQVTIKAGEIGGPSAGLMFSLEIYNQLSTTDITKGYKIAGTGTIDEKGTVGVIGGIQHKIVAADEAGADIFFAPKDYSAGGQTVPNYTDAKKRAEEIKSAMKIVPVGTMDDALQYLASLPPKAN